MQSQRAPVLTRYDQRNSEHQQSIHAHIRLFEKANNNLITFDLSCLFGTWISSSVLSWTMGFIPQLCLSGAGTYYLLPEAYKEHRHLALLQSEALQDCYKLYLTCIKSNDLSITYDETFLELLRTLARYIPSIDMLFVWDREQVSHQDFSPEFLSILSAAPHNAQFISLAAPQSVAARLLNRVTTMVGVGVQEAATSTLPFSVSTTKLQSLYRFWGATNGIRASLNQVIYGLPVDKAELVMTECGFKR